MRPVDMAIAKPQRLFDHARASAPAQVPGAEANDRDAGWAYSLRLRDLHASQRGACGGLTTRPPGFLSFSISAICARVREKSNSARLAAR